MVESFKSVGALAAFVVAEIVPDLKGDVTLAYLGEDFPGVRLQTGDEAAIPLLLDRLHPDTLDTIPVYLADARDFDFTTVRGSAWRVLSDIAENDWDDPPGGDPTWHELIRRGDPAVPREQAMLIEELAADWSGSLDELWNASQDALGIAPTKPPTLAKRGRRVRPKWPTARQMATSASDAATACMTMLPGRLGDLAVFYRRAGKKRTELVRVISDHEEALDQIRDLFEPESLDEYPITLDDYNGVRFQVCGTAEGYCRYRAGAVERRTERFPKSFSLEDPMWQMLSKTIPRGQRLFLEKNGPEWGKASDLLWLESVKG